MKNSEVLPGEQAMLKTTNSINAFQESQQYIPGGVNSPVRAFKHVSGTPLFIKKALGEKIWDIDDNEYTDYSLSWGVFIAGHNHPEIKKSVIAAIENGTSYGAPTLMETELAKLIIQDFSSIEKIRFVSSGTEAVMSAIRLARAYTGKKYIIKFDGCYHGHSDSLLVKAGSGLITAGITSSAGLLEETAKFTISLPFNDTKSVQQCFESLKNEIAAIILEPVPANMGVINPKKEFLTFLRQITQQNNSALIFDEVITAYRAGIVGAQTVYNITPDLTCLGKIIGGGFPVGAFGGKKEIMDLLAPLGNVYQAGTLSGNPIAMTAGIATIKLLHQKDFYEKLISKTSQKVQELQSLIKNQNYTLNQYGSMFTFFFENENVCDYNSALKSNVTQYAYWHNKLLSQGIYWVPSQFEANFICLTS